MILDILEFCLLCESLHKVYTSNHDTAGTTLLHPLSIHSLEKTIIVYPAFNTIVSFSGTSVGPVRLLEKVSARDAEQAQQYAEAAVKYALAGTMQIFYFLLDFLFNILELGVLSRLSDSI